MRDSCKGLLCISSADGWAEGEGSRTELGVEVHLTPGTAREGLAEPHEAHVRGPCQSNAAERHEEERDRNAQQDVRRM